MHRGVLFRLVWLKIVFQDPPNVRFLLSGERVPAESSIFSQKVAYVHTVPFQGLILHSFFNHRLFQKPDPFLLGFGWFPEKIRIPGFRMGKLPLDKYRITSVCQMYKYGTVVWMVSCKDSDPWIQNGIGR